MDDLLVFNSENEHEHTWGQGLPWKILVVDDDDQVHKVTSLALSDIRILDRPLQFVHAYSAAEAREILEKEADIAVILLDVVMEHDNSGLELAKIIRTELKLDAPRIILRTGQPGYAPELEVIQNYDINDYRMKSELTRTRLITALTTAVRSYQQVHKIQRGEIGMRTIIEATNHIFNTRDHEYYSADIIKYTAKLLNIESVHGLVVIEMRSIGNGGNYRHMYVSGAEGKYSDNLNQSINDIPQVSIKEEVERCIDQQASLFSDKSVAVFFDNEGKRGCLYLDTSGPIDQVAKSLIEVFAVSIGVGFSNINLITQLNQYAYFDQLSRLPNRTRFLLEVNKLGSKHANYMLGVLDIDNFSAVNNALGHKNGDLLIQAIADRLANSLPGDLLIARIGGDTFGLLGPENKMVPEDLLRPFDRPFVIKNTPFPIGATLGLAPVESLHGQSFAVLKNADMAMKIAKLTTGASFMYYSEDMAHAAEQRLEITKDLHPALARDEFVVYYQPQVDLSSNKLTGVESLVRWVKPDGSIISPGQFIPVAESTGVIIDIGKQVFRKSCRQAKTWLENGILDFKIAINVSVRQFSDPDFIPSLKQILREEEMDASRFELEITESTLMNEVESTIKLLEELNAIGFALSIDDFGTGYSSLNYLLRLPIQRLKVDRSFVMNVEHDEKARTISGLIVSMANNLGILTIAEGIETEGQLEFIRNLGCKDAQGFYYSKPLSCTDFEQWYEKFKK